MAQTYTPEPTIQPNPNFNVAEDGAALRGAMKGLGTDEDTIIDLLSSRSNNQRQQLAKFFADELGRDLIEDLRSELGGKFESLIVALCMPPSEYLAKQLNKAMEGMGTDEDTLVEILCSNDNNVVQGIVDAYERMYGRPLAEHMCSETSGDLRRLLTLIVTGVRDHSSEDTDADRAKELAESLHNSGEGKLGTDEEVFNRILAHESFPQLRLIFEEYKNVSGRTIEQAINDEIGGQLKDALLAIVECVQCPPTFFAKRLNAAVAGAGTDDVTLVRIIISRSEIDLGSIKKEYERIYDKTLQSAIENDTSGDYKKALLALIGVH